MVATTTDSMYRLLVQGITDYAIYMLSPQGIVSNWNAGAERFKGYKSDEIVGHHFSDFYTDEDRLAGLPKRALDTALREIRFEGEGWRVRKDGTRFWAHVIIDRLDNEDGSVLGFAKITRDLTAQRASQMLASEQERNFRLLVQGVTDYAIYMLTPDGTVSNWNAGAERAKGYRADEIVGQHFSRFYSFEDRCKGLPQRALATALAKGKFEGEGWRLRRDGSRLWAHIVIDPIRDEQGVLIGFAKITRDMSDYKKQMDEVSHVKEHLDLALANMSQGLCLFDEHEELIVCNTRFQEIMGFLPGVIQPGSTFVDMLWAMRGSTVTDPMAAAEEIRLERLDHFALIDEADRSVSFEQVLHGRTVSVIHRRLTSGGWVSTMNDVTERREIESRISHLAHHDSLTELPNRATFRDHIDHALAEHTQFALLYLDLDRFKPINDTLGHPVGDIVLQTVAKRIAAQLRKDDIGARLGGDEFAVLLLDCQREEDAYGIADRLIHEIRRPIAVNDLDVSIGVSVGIAFSPAHGTDADMLLRDADLALYAAKDAGRNCHRAYQNGMEEIIHQRRELEGDLRKALLHNEFSLHYQPVVDIVHNAVSSFEALLRWQHPTRGNVSPVDFIPFAEELGLMPEIGEWVLRTACLQAKQWAQDVSISVNLSVTQLRLPNLVETILAILSEVDLPAARLELEITETAMIVDVERTTTILKQLRAHGIHIALDDFGTGYSSLSFLRNLPFTRIKIDRSFIQDLGVKREAAAIVRAIARLCDSIGVATTAEGVETEQQLDILHAEGCHEVQGYLICRPSPPPAIESWFTAYKDDSTRKPRLLAKSA